MLDIRESLKSSKRFLDRKFFRKLNHSCTQYIELAAYRGLCEQAYSSPTFCPYISSSVWGSGKFWSSNNCPTSPQRELTDTSHYYGHDIVLKRFADLPLVGPYLRHTVEHGLKVNPKATFEPLAKGTHSYLCMGDLRASSIRDHIGANARAIGPWIHYAESFLSMETLTDLKRTLGKTLLVILAHNWPGAERSFDRGISVEEITRIQQAEHYDTVLLSSHFLDKDYLWPHDWIKISHGHKYNPWYLDCLKTALYVSDGLATNYFSSHVGYAYHEKLALHWINQGLTQDISGIDKNYEKTEADEWGMRNLLASKLIEILESSESQESKSRLLYKLLDPYWGFSAIKTSYELKQILIK